MSDETPVVLRRDLIQCIPRREWGLPTAMEPGKLWRSADRGFVTVVLFHEDGPRMESRQLIPLPEGKPVQDEWMPPHWREAVWRYCQAWPDSAWRLAPFLDISEAERQSFVRKLLCRALDADDIGVLDCARVAAAFATDWPILGTC